MNSRNVQQLGAMIFFATIVLVLTVLLCSGELSAGATAAAISVLATCGIAFIMAFVVLLVDSSR